MAMTDDPGVLAVGVPVRVTPQRVSFFEQVNINVYWIANNFQWNALQALVIPSMVAKLLDPAHKDINLTLVAVWGTLLAVAVNPLTGTISDYATFRMGRRRPFPMFGTALNILVLLAFAFSPSLHRDILLLTFALLFLLLQLSNQVAHAPWNAIIADKVPQQQRGLASGLNGLFTLLGTALGILVAGHIVNKRDLLPMYKDELAHIFLLIAAIQAMFVIYTVLTVKEAPLTSHERARFQISVALRMFFFKPSRYPDLSWVLLARLLIMMGIWGIIYFLQYYFDDVLHVVGEQFLAISLQVLLVAALPTSLLAGWASDHWGRKGILYLSGALMTLVCLLFILFQNPLGALIAAAFFGIAYGAYTSVDWALATDTLPPTDEAGKFMGIWSAMGILPQLIGITMGGVILQLLRSFPNHLGYTALFIVSMCYFGLGTLVLRQVRG